MKLSDIKRNPDAIEQGEWVGEKYGTAIPDMGELCLKVRGLDNADAQRLQATLARAIPRARRFGGRIDPADSDKIMARCLLDCCLIDWDGVEDADGKPVPYSKEQAAELLLKPEWKAFREAVAWAASLVGQHVAADNTADAKN